MKYYLTLLVSLPFFVVGCLPQEKETFERKSIDATVGGLNSPNGTPAQIQFHESRHIKNTVGTDRKGLCVFTSMAHAGDWQNDHVFEELLVWMRNKPGGGYPSKVDKMLQEFCKQKGYKMPNYIQIEDTDLDVLRFALKNGYMPCVTYGISPTGRYNGQRIAHMVNLVHGDKDYFGVLDNNYVGKDSIEWLSPQEFLRSYTITGGNGWSIILLQPGYPKPPRN